MTLSISFHTDVEGDVYVTIGELGSTEPMEGYRVFRHDTYRPEKTDIRIESFRSLDGGQIHKTLRTMPTDEVTQRHLEDLGWITRARAGTRWKSSTPI